MITGLHDRPIIEHIVCVFPAILFIAFLAMKILAPSAYLSVVQEDSLIEYLQALLYLAASAISFIVSRRFYKNRMKLHGHLHLILCLGLLFISMEELSWGQRIFNISPSEYILRYNTQRELTVHNMAPVQKLLHLVYIMVGFYGAFAWLIAGRAVSRYWPSAARMAEYLYPRWFLSPYFFFAFAVYCLLTFICPVCTRLGADCMSIGRFIIWRDQEPVELILSAGFFLFALDGLIRIRRNVTGN